MLGDSLSAAYGIEIETGWVALLQQRLRDRGYPHQIVNASQSGETSAGGRARLPALLAGQAMAIVILELGGNDGLRGLALGETQANLQAMTRAAKGAGAKVLLLGMRLPPNYGHTYTQAFTELYSRVAEQEAVPLLDFLLEGVADRPELMQPDRIHPRAQAQPRILENVWPLLRPLL